MENVVNVEVAHVFVSFMAYGRLAKRLGDIRDGRTKVPMGFDVLGSSGMEGQTKGHFLSVAASDIRCGLFRPVLQGISMVREGCKRVLDGIYLGGLCNLN